MYSCAAEYINIYRGILRIAAKKEDKEKNNGKSMIRTKKLLSGRQILKKFVFKTKNNIDNETQTGQ